MRRAERSRLPLVALVGRANVGKSRLFNRLVGAPRALVENRPGVTRDRVVARARIEGRELLLVDTGGLDPEAREGIPAAVLRQVDRVLEDAAVILCVVDVRAGPSPLDREIADRLRAAPGAVIVVANKADGPRQEMAALEFHALGFETLIPISAEHRRGIADLELAIAERLPALEPEVEGAGDVAPRLALVGRPNAGKSSLLNRLLGDEHAIVSETPGTTRDATDVRLRVPGEDAGREVVLIDTAGLRRPARRASPIERGSAYMALRALERADLAVLVIDAEVGPAEQDAKIARMALDCGRALLPVLNKWDLVGETVERRQVERRLERRLAFVPDPVVLRVSAETGEGTQQLLPAALELMDSLRGDVPTARLNRLLEEALDRNPPPLQGRRRARFYYATQVSSRPLTILAFVNDSRLIPKSYRRYLESWLRKRLDLRAAPLRLRLRTRPRNDGGRGRSRELQEGGGCAAESEGDARLGTPSGPEGRQER